MKEKLAQLTDKQKLIGVSVILLLLVGAGVATWVWDMRSSNQGEQQQATPPQQEPTAVEPVPGETSEESDYAEPSESATEVEADVSQEDSAKEALEAVVPKWASLQVSEVGSDSGQWLDTWQEEPAAGESLKTQSRNNFVGLFKGIINLNVDAKVDTLKDIESAWQQDNLSGWEVSMDRKLESFDESGGVNETETVTWEFTVEQQSDGSSQITGYSATAADHEDLDHDH